MNQIINYPEGGTIEITENGLKITSVIGEVLEIGRDGRLKNQQKKNEPSFFKYFFFMGKTERDEVKEWCEKVKAETEEQLEFLKIVGTAVNCIDHDYRIATIEPSLRLDGKIFYKAGEEVARGLSCREWEKKAVEFAPKYFSRLANIFELFLWYAYRIVKGYWTIEYICDDSSSAGNYYNSPKAKRDYELSGVRKVGGFSDGTGNTIKFVKGYKDDVFFMCGGSCVYNGDDFPVTDTGDVYHHNKIFPDGTGWLVLQRNLGVKESNKN